MCRIICADQSALQLLQFTLTAGKKTFDLDLDNEDGKATLRELLKDADVVIQGYRIRSLERRGFGLDDLLAMANARGRGIVYLDENCFGPDGCWAERPGWQQIADAAAGSTYVMGRAYGYTNGECVLPSLPISDMSTGAVSLVAVLMALRDRAKFGGSYYGAAALTAYNTFTLQEEVGLYQPDVVAKIQEMWSFPKMTPEHHVYDLLFMLWKAWVKKGGLVDSEDFYAHFRDTAFGRNMKILAPIIQYANDEVNPRWITPPQPYCYNTGAIAFANASG